MKTMAENEYAAITTARADEADESEAGRIATVLLERKLAACVHNANGKKNKQQPDRTTAKYEEHHGNKRTKGLSINNLTK
jgi:uncharacterized protein involved in tolerance to divalent cations